MMHDSTIIVMGLGLPYCLLLMDRTANQQYTVRDTPTHDLQIVSKKPASVSRRAKLGLKETLPAPALTD